MERMGRYDRYRITENKSGIFEVDAYENEHSQKIIPVEGRLKVCKSCLLELHYFNIYSYRDLDHQDWISFAPLRIFNLILLIMVCILLIFRVLLA